MRIKELSRHASLDFLSHSRFGRLGCAKDLQPYVTPFYFAYHDRCIHSFGTVGQKIEWMRANPLVCVEVDEVISPQQWKSVIVFGRYEELPNSPELRSVREHVQRVLGERTVWWEPGYARTILSGGERPLVPVFFRIFVEQVTGHQAFPDPSAQ